MREPHRCDDRCKCPVHGKVMFYAPDDDEHACVDPDCVYAHGYERTVGVEACPVCWRPTSATGHSAFCPRGAR